MSTSVDRPPPPAPEPELRPRASRAPLVHAVMCRYADAADFVEVTTLNISQSGMLVRGESLPPVGCDLEFKFVLESGFELLTGKGKVMRHSTDPGAKTAAGIAFFDLEPAKLRILARVVELHSEDENAD
jgi:PilZ domain